MDQEQGFGAEATEDSAAVEVTEQGGEAAEATESSTVSE